MRDFPILYDTGTKEADHPVRGLFPRSRLHHLHVAEPPARARTLADAYRDAAWPADADAV